MGHYLELANKALEQVTGQEQGASSVDALKIAWPYESLEAELRFGGPHARLFPFLGRKVRTPKGPGTLLQVFANQVTILLDSELSRCTWFQPEEVKPVSPE